jgi:predicted nucleotidyltransferase
MKTSSVPLLAQKEVQPQVVPITARKRIPQEAIEQVVRTIVERFQPQRVILFGSYAYGEPRPESDVDLLVVMETSLKETEQAVRICQAIDYHFGLDLIVCSPAKLEQRLSLGDWFLREAVGRGKVLYERADS